jgi:hypothetical protein
MERECFSIRVQALSLCRVAVTFKLRCMPKWYRYLINLTSRMVVGCPIFVGLEDFTL